MIRILIASLVAATLLAGPQARAQEGSEIGIDQDTEFSLNGQSVAFLYVDAPEGTEALRFDLDAVDGVSDLDLLVRSDTPFTRDGAVDVQALVDQAQYRSISASGDELVVVDGASRFPARATRWYVAAFNFGTTPAVAKVRVSALAEAPVVPIEVVYNDGTDDCDTGPWTQERRAAMDRAAELLTEQIRPRATVRVQACWEVPESEGTLAFAGPNFLVVNDLGFRGSRFGGSDSDRGPLPLNFLLERYSVVGAAVGTHNAGTSLCRWLGGSCDGAFDIRATFNPEADFYYGLDRMSPGGSANFISTAMHEITHGLGFYGLLDSENGSRRTDYDDPYTANVRATIIGQGSVGLLDMTDEERAAALTSNNLRFTGPLTQELTGGSVKLYAPGTPNPGSTLSHLDTLTLGTELMAHRIPGAAPHELGLAQPILFDIGWDPAAKEASAPFLPPSGQYFDPQRDGHGIALYRIAGFEDFYFVVFYSYDDAGLPEYFVANGRMRDGVLVASRNEFGDSLVRSLYDDANSPPNGPDPGAAFEGLIRIDFNQAAKSPVCVGDSEPAEGITSAVVTFTLPGQDVEQWCLQGIAEGLEVQTDLTNIFFNPADPGWGASVLSFPGDGGDGLGMQVYYPDAEGNPRWAIMGTANYQVGGTYDLEQVIGYCRGCPKPATLERVKVGEVTIGLQPVGGGLESTLTFDVSFDGGAGGSFTRDTTVVAGGASNSGGGRVAHVTSLGLSNPTTVRLAKRLVDLSPPGLNHVFFSDSGASAVEVALKLAFQYWRQCEMPQPQRTKYLAFDAAYHGDTLGSVSVGGVARFHAMFEPLLFDVVRLPAPVGPAASLPEHLSRLDAALTEHGSELAALVIEPLVQCAAGMLMHPPGYLQGVRELTRKHDVLLIADEVAVGMGRTGTLFASEQESVSPDLLCLAKGLTGGYLPIAATLATSEIWRAFLGKYEDSRSFFHGHTYGGNPLGCAAALATLEVFEEEQTLEKLPAKIARLQEHLLRISQLPHVGEVRQRGLIAGVDLVPEKASPGKLYPWHERRGLAVCQHALKEGVWLRPLGSTLVIMPPLAITLDELDRICLAVEHGVLKLLIAD